jgi:hypothetical protein
MSNQKATMVFQDFSIITSLIAAILYGIKYRSLKSIVWMQTCYNKQDSFIKPIVDFPL